MKIRKEQWMRWGEAAASPLLAGWLLLVVYALFGFYPFGGESVAWCDMNQQVIPLLGEFRGILLGDGSFFRSGGGGGVNFWGIFFFFLSSPFSLLAVFCPLEGLPLLMNWLLLLKLMLCAGTCSALFRSLDRGKLGRAFPALAGVMYAFSGYSVQYYQNIGWLDMMALFPLLLLSLIRLEKKRQILPFVLVFSGMLTVSYYLSYMVLLFLLLFMGVWLLVGSSSRRGGGTALLLGCGTALSLLITAVVWLPSLLEVLKSARGSGLAESLAAGDFRAQVYTTIPVLLATALPLGAAVLFRKRIWRSGVFSAALFMAALLAVPMFIRPVNKMWHTGSYQGFPVRYGYMATLLLMLCAFWVIRRRAPAEDPSRSDPGAVGALALLVAGYSGFAWWSLHTQGEVLSTYVRKLWGSRESFLGLLVGAVLAAGLYGGILWAWHKGALSRRCFGLFLAAAVAAESLFSCGVYMGPAARDQGNYREAVAMAGVLPETGFYRLKTREKYFDVNLFSAMGDESLSHYTSLTPRRTLVSQRRLGYSGYWMEVSSVGGTAFSDAVLANRYQVRRLDQLEPEELAQAVYQGESYAILPLPWALPDALITSVQPGFLEEVPAGSRMAAQAALAEALFPGNPGLFTGYSPENWENVRFSEGKYLVEHGKTGVLTYRIPVSGPTILYFDCAAPADNRLKPALNGSCTIEVDGVPLRTDFPTQKENGILELGFFTQGAVEITVKLSKSIAPESFEVFGLDAGVLDGICASARGAELEGGGSRFALSCQAEEGETLFLPLAYDQGWRAKVNGAPAALFPAAGGYLSLALQPGENRVELSYTPPGLWAGLALTGLGLLLAVGFFWKGKKWLLRKRGLRKAARALLFCAAAGVAAAVYVMPVAVYFWKNGVGK